MFTWLIKVMDDKIWLDEKRKIACGTSYLVIGAIRNLKNYSNKQPKMKWFCDVLEVQDVFARKTMSRKQLTKRKRHSIEVMLFLLI
jgi:hypothetical protein